MELQPKFQFGLNLKNLLIVTDTSRGTKIFSSDIGREVFGKKQQTTFVRWILYSPLNEPLRHARTECSDSWVQSISQSQRRN